MGNSIDSTWSLRRTLVACVAVGLAVAPSCSGMPSAGSRKTLNARSTWTPAVGTSWNYQLAKPPTTNDTLGFDVWGIDLFDSPASLIAGLQKNGSHVICYFSAGSYENWRPDASKFQPSDLGKDLNGWPGEKWLNVNSANVRSIMQSRLDLAVTKGCNGVDPDNVDGYDNANGLNLTKTDAVNYVKFLSSEAHSRGLASGLKNAGGIISQVISVTDWSVNEQCTQYSECATYAPYITAGKPVFHVEYPKGDTADNNNPASQAKYNQICGDKSAAGFSTIMKNMLLDTWIETCSK